MTISISLSNIFPKSLALVRSAHCLLHYFPWETQKCLFTPDAGGETDQRNNSIHLGEFIEATCMNGS